MKTTKLAIALCLFAGASFAQEAPAPAEKDAVDACATVGDLAESVMRNRQQGISMSRMMEIAKDSDLVRAIVIAAYDQPRMSVDRNIQRSIDDFRNEVMLQCYQVND
jgi:hypothetical protein